MYFPDREILITPKGSGLEYEDVSVKTKITLLLRAGISLQKMKKGFFCPVMEMRGIFLTEWTQYAFSTTVGSVSPGKNLFASYTSFLNLL